MRLTDLHASYSGADNPDIAGLSADSRQVRPGWLFAAIPGSKYDGRDFIEDAVRNGAVAVLVPAGTVVPDGIVSIEDDNPRRALAHMAARFYGRQPQTIVAVTGTNGKTSTVHFTQQLWEALGIRAASLGTLGVRGADMVKSGSMTTPDTVALHATLADLDAVGFDHLAMEASSHGLDQFRLDAVSVSAAGFTNLSHEHLDYHSSMDAYRAAKARLFSDILRPDGVAVLNADSPDYDAMAAQCAGRTILDYGMKARALKIVALAPAPHGQSLTLDIRGRRYAVDVPLVGAFMVMNALCALGLVLASGQADEARAVAALGTLKGAPGRLQLVPGHGPGAVYVDYAHTPDALETILHALRPHTDGRLICLIGCGGDRDRGKRPVMGRIASELADIAIITDDNPRSENPADIRAAMMAGAGDNAVEIGGRRHAIRHGTGLMRDGDVFVIAGKGHEQGQTIGGVTEPFDDVMEAQSAMNEKKDVLV